MLHRKVYNQLVKWKNSNHRKPLLLRGARQVGKTTIIDQFSSEFSHYVKLNLEIEAERNLFEINDIEKLVNAIFLLKGEGALHSNTLLFIDEIQESPKAIKQLRYFYESKPDLFVVAAGSLLEFSLKDVASFPVGRIEYLYVHPLNFEEFLGAISNQGVVDALKTIPVPDYAHKILMDLFHEYAIIGGMPEVVSNYVRDKDIAKLAKNYNQLWEGYKGDVEKYARNATEQKVIRHVIETAPLEPDRIKFEGFGNSNYRSREVGESLRALDLAQIVRLIYPSTNVKPPIISNLRKRPRLQFLDTGLLNQSLLLQGEMIGVADLNDFHRGKIIQHLVSQELISIHEEERYKPNFWVRENKDSNSEVDLVYRSGKYIIPIEVKSGKSGKLKSLHQFVIRSDHPYAVRMGADEFGVEEVKTQSGKPYLLMNIPYYLGTQIEKYLSYFINNYRL